MSDAPSKTNQHTPGPWAVADNRSLNGAWWITTKHPEGWEVSVAEVRNGCDEADEIGDVEANARLIAAAPDLLEALQKIAAMDKHSGASLRDRAASEIARAAIAKADGQ